jgi:hypothetical protein
MSVGGGSSGGTPPGSDSEVVQQKMREILRLQAQVRRYILSY